MAIDRKIYNEYIAILKEELRPAMGCTEPISVAYASAVARETLGILPQEVDICVSANIIKNVKNVVVPNTGGLRGLEAASAAGIVAGNAAKELEVIADIRQGQLTDIADYLKTATISVREAESGKLFDICITIRSGKHSAKCRITDNHTNIVLLEKDGEVLKDISSDGSNKADVTDRSLLSVTNIIAFAKEVDINDIRDINEQQIRCNMAIAEAGMAYEYGACVGQTLKSAYEDNVYNRAKAYAAAASDARMSGCELPVIITSGSGNQGITASVPVIIFAREMKATDEQLYRALVLSSLITIHLKTGIGPLSAYCGAVSAGCGAGAGICFLYGGDSEQIAATVQNALAIDSGMICDGANTNCAAKIASAVEAGMLAVQMSFKGRQFADGDGIVGNCVEKTIQNVGYVASCGMAETDKEIIRIMLTKA